MGPENMSWHLKLPADLQRAAPELYRNIRAEGVSSVRQWVNEQHPTLEQKNSVQYQDLFMAATIIDFEVADCVTEGALMQKLATSDSLEIHLRKLGAFIYYRRTKDKTGANRMLGVRAPGTNADIAPKWMLDDANTHSKTEMQRIERGSKMAKSDYGGGGGGGAGKTRKGDGKGRGRGRGKPSSGLPHKAEKSKPLPGIPLLARSMGCLITMQSGPNPVCRRFSPHWMNSFQPGNPGLFFHCRSQIQCIGASSNLVG